MPTTTAHQLGNGSVTLYSAHTGFPGPKTVPIKLTLNIGDDGSVAVSDFTVEPITGIEASGRTLDLHVGLSSSAKGVFHAASGALVINCVFDYVFRKAGTEVERAELDIQVQTHQATMPDGTQKVGSPVAADGKFRLVSNGQFSLAPPDLDGVACGVVLAGVLQPSPRP